VLQPIVGVHTVVASFCLGRLFYFCRFEIIYIAVLKYIALQAN
jgi:hypothetical protein